MDGGDDLPGWAADGVAAGLLGAAVGTALLLLGWALPGVMAAAVTSLGTLALLRQVTPEPRRFSLPAFALAPVPVVVAEPVTDVLELTEVAEPEPLLLTERHDEPAPDSRVVSLFGARPLPTPGELRQRIKEHLERQPEPGRRPVLELEVDAAAALREALGELRRNLA